MTYKFFHENIGTFEVPAALKIAIVSGWSAFSSTSDAWRPERPEHGQDRVTACILQDYLGGVLMRSQVAGLQHTYNFIDQQVVDLTMPPEGMESAGDYSDVVSRSDVLHDAAAKSIYLWEAGRVAIAVGSAR